MVWPPFFLNLKRESPSRRCIESVARTIDVWFRLKNHALYFWHHRFFILLAVTSFLVILDEPLQPRGDMIHGSTFAQDSINERPPGAV